MPVYHNQSLLAVIGITGEPDTVRKYAHLAERITKSSNPRTGAEYDQP